MILHRMPVGTETLDVHATRLFDPPPNPHLPGFVLVHGNPGSIKDMLPLGERLAATCNVLLLDLPGFGESEAPSHPTSLALDALADLTLSVARSAGLAGPLYLVGHSHGGAVVQTLAARHASDVAGLVLLGTLGAHPHGSYRLLGLPGSTLAARVVAHAIGARPLRPLFRFIIARAMTPIFAPEKVGRAAVEGQLDAFSRRPHILRSMVQVARGNPCKTLREQLDSIACPVLFLHGAQERLVAPHFAEALHQGLVANGVESQWHLVPGAGHMAGSQQPGTIADAIHRWLEALDGR